MPAAGSAGRINVKLIALVTNTRAGRLTGDAGLSARSALLTHTMENGPSPIASELDESVYTLRQTYEAHSLIEGIYTVAQQHGAARTESLASELSQDAQDAGEPGADEPDAAPDAAPTLVGNNTLPSDGSAGSMREYTTTHILESALGAQVSRMAFSTNPPRDVRHARYPERVHETVGPDPLAGYTQNLIWCLSRRVAGVRRRPPPTLKVANGRLLLAVLEKILASLASGDAQPDPARAVALELKPQLANPANVRCAEIVADLDACKTQLTHGLDHFAIVFAETEQALLAAADARPERAAAPDEYGAVVADARALVDRQTAALTGVLESAEATLNAACATLVRRHDFETRRLRAVYAPPRALRD